jgi:methionyl-tRNA formyltransferase
VLGGRLIVEALELAACGGIQGRAQPEQGVTYAHKIDKREAEIDWRADAAVIERRLRAFDPFPGASTSTPIGPVKCWRGVTARGHGAAGEVLAVDDAGIEVACGGGSLRFTELQRPGGRRLGARAFLQGHPIPVGARLGPAPD